MLGAASRFQPLWKTLFGWVFPAVVLVVAAGAFTWNREAVFFGGATYFTDGDCYARMTRVRMLLQAPLTPIRHHDFENAPAGTTPHTTAPLDYGIAGLSVLLRPFAADPLSLAGAWVSPLLGLLTVGVLLWWGRGRPFGWAAAVLVAVSPMASHGFLLGRPDHQSLLMLLIAVALLAEISLWSGARRELISAAAWALALWVSLFEPLILLSAVLVARLLARRLAFSGRPLALFGGILIAAFLFDGIRAAPFDSHFADWAKNIGELRHGSIRILIGWSGWLALALPVLLVIRFLRAREPVCLLMAGLVLLLGALSLWHLRWGYFFVLVVAVALPFGLEVFRRRSVVGALFVVSLWPVASEWDRTLFPTDEAFRQRGEGITDAGALRDAALSLKGRPPGAVIAPWWFSPAVVWWSGQPCVAGTSHQSLPGIADTAGFYLSESGGRDILERRSVKYFIAYEPSRVISNSAQILNSKPPFHPLAESLYFHPRASEFELIHSNRFFRVFATDQK